VVERKHAEQLAGAEWLPRGARYSN